MTAYTDTAVTPKTPGLVTLQFYDTNKSLVATLTKMSNLTEPTNQNNRIATPYFVDDTAPKSKEPSIEGDYSNFTDLTFDHYDRIPDATLESVVYARITCTKISLDVTYKIEGFVERSDSGKAPNSAVKYNYKAVINNQEDSFTPGA